MHGTMPTAVLLDQYDQIVQELIAPDRSSAVTDDENTIEAAAAVVRAWLTSQEGVVGPSAIEEGRTVLERAWGEEVSFDPGFLSNLPEGVESVTSALLRARRAGTQRAREDVEFWINGSKHRVSRPDPRTLLLDYLRSEEVGLTGTKKVCAQGGCGACTVALSSWNPRTERVEHRGINACLRPLCSLDGMAVTTIEGIGSVRTELSPVQYQMAIDNASQCGYCTPGWVMSMHTFLQGRGKEKATQAEIEACFDGNLCRCTGFRPILYAMRHFAADWTPADAKGSMVCKPWPTYDAHVGGASLPEVAPHLLTDVPDGIRELPFALDIARDGYRWIRVLTMEDLDRVLAEHGSVDDLKLVVGNTSIGIYGEPAQDVCYGAPHIRVDIAHVPELHGLTSNDEGITMGAATTYSELIAFLQERQTHEPKHRQIGLEALRYMAERTAGRIVRDVASLAGNTMLVVRHIETGTPFPSDLFTALTMMDAHVDVTCPAWGETRRLPLLEFANAWQRDEDLQRGAVLLRYYVPWTQENEWARTFKVALREVNAHSIVNAGMRVRFGKDATVAHAAIVCGGIGPVAFHLREVETWLVGQSWNEELLAGGLERVAKAVRDVIANTAERMASVPAEGFSSAYRTHLAETYFYQFFLWLAEQTGTPEVPSAVQSAGERAARPVSRGRQKIQRYPDEAPVGVPYIKADAFLQTTGEAVYTHDAQLPARGVYGAFVLATRPRAWFRFVWPDGPTSTTRVSSDELARALKRRFECFVDLVTAADIPASGNNQAHSGDPEDPLLCAEQVTACGQALAIVLATTEQEAVNIAHWVQVQCVAYEMTRTEGDDEATPILTLEEAIEAKNFLVTNNVWGIERPHSRLDWIDAEVATVDEVPCRVVGGAQMSRTAQMHFYMETQAALATPDDNGGVTVLCSTQNPNTILESLTNTLGLPANKIDVQIKRLGGGYGGKGPRSPWAAANASVAALKIGRPVKIAVTRETDSALFGHENPLLGEYRFAIGTGADNPEHRGRLMGLDIRYYMNAGNTADCSPVVMDCTLLRADNSYLVPNYRTKGWVCLTNTISNTSFRTLDAISGIIILEDGLEAAAHAVELRPEEVREKNLYRLGDFAPYGEPLEYCYLRDVWSYTKTRSDFDRRLEDVRAFNQANRWRKRGISLMPVKYGMGFNATFLERGDALIDVYDNDGTVLVRHGGVEMGQGLNTQVAQLVAETLNVPLYLVQVGLTSTAVIPNPISTGASTGTAFNGGAARKAAERLRARLEKFCVDLLNQKGAKWCRENHVDFWSYESGWNTEIEAGGSKKLMWNAIVAQANMARVNLSMQAQHNERGGSNVDTGLVFHPGTSEEVQYFVGYTYSAACSEVEVNILTGEVTVLRSDLVYDMGKSLNPATDVGQIEGAFVQGVGRVLLEDVVWQLEEPGLGRNNTPNTWGYKIPATTTVPLELNVDLYPRDDSAQVPENPNLLMSAKECGEPPMCLAATVYFAVKHAILDSRSERGKRGWFRLDMPCTVQRVREACEVEPHELRL